MTKREKFWAVIAYIPIFNLIPFLKKSKSPFLDVHTKQGFILTFFLILILFGLWIPIIGWVIGAVMVISYLILLISGIVFALSGKDRRLPVIGLFFEKLFF